MPDYGTLNGQLVGPDLPPPVSCEVCGHPVWLTAGAAVLGSKDQTVHIGPSIWEQGFPQPGQAWALTQHICRQS